MLDTVTTLPLKDPHAVPAGQPARRQMDPGRQRQDHRGQRTRRPAKSIGRRARHGRRRDAPRDRGREPGAARPGARCSPRSARRSCASWFDLMMANQDDLARHHDRRAGQAAGRSRGEIAYAASFIEWFAEEGKRIYGDTIPQTAAGRRILVTKQPIGVFAAITPWNFPTAMITRKAGPALAAGCTVVIKPGERRRRSRPSRWPCWRERAGMPAGVLNVVTGAAATIGGGTDRQPAGAQAHLHRLDRGRRACCWRNARRRSRRPAGTGRQRAVHRVRRRRPRRGGRGRDGLASTATPARPASAPTASWCRTASTTPSPPS